jgi:hypothetical protein
MKKILVSAGLAAISAATLHADVYAPDVTAMDASRIWSVSGTLRGFYDSNYNTAPSSSKQASSGFEFSPTVGLILPLQQTEIGLRYTYGLYYYQKREDQGTNPYDQSHQADLWIDHAFTERLDGKVEDVFVSAQNPSLTPQPTALPYRVNGNNIQNVGTVSLHTELSMLFSTDVGYQNTWLHYQEHGASTDPTSSSFVGDGSGATYAGLLNSVDNNIWFNFNYQFQPDLMFLVGYQLGLMNYTGNEPIAQDPVSGNFYYSGDRNNRSQNIYVGAQYSVTENLSTSLQVGGQYTDNYNLPSFDHQSTSQWTPTANLVATYTYLPGDYIQAGFTESLGSSDISQVNSGGELTLNTENSVVYASINHQVTPKLLASLIGHYQYSKYNAGAFDNGAQNWYSFGLNLTYNFMPWLSGELGYNFDDLITAVPNSNYVRSRVYFGFTASY